MTWLTDWLVDGGPPVARGGTWKGAPEESFVHEWAELFEDSRFEVDRRRLRGMVSGGVLLDLGGGRAGLFGPYAVDLELNTWVIVDTQLHSEWDPRRDLRGEVAPPVGGYPVGVRTVQVACDMLDLLRRAPEASAHALLCGIDEDVIADGAYHREVVEQLSRVVPRDGLVLCSESSALEELVLHSDFDRVNLDFVRWNDARQAREQALGGPRFLGTAIFRRVR